MRSAMRDPVLQDKNFVKARAATQRFYGVDPSAYMALGAAQSRAALAQGRMGLQFGETVQRATNAAIEADSILQTAAADSALSELKSWSAEYAADISENDLTFFDGDKYGYEKLQEQYKKDLEKKKSELRSRYKFSNGGIVNDYNNKARGVETALGNRVGDFTRNAQLDLGRAEVQRRMNKGFDTREELYGALDTASAFYSPEEMVKMEAVALSAFEGRQTQTLIDGVKTSNKALSLIEEELIEKVKSGNTRLTSSQLNEFGSQIRDQMKSNILNADAKMATAETIEELDAAYAEAMEMGNFSGSSQEDIEPHLRMAQAAYEEQANRIAVTNLTDMVRDSKGRVVLTEENIRAQSQAAYDSPHLTEKGREEVYEDIEKNVIEYYASRMRLAEQAGTSAKDYVNELALDPTSDLMLPKDTEGSVKLGVITELQKIATDLAKKAEDEAARLVTFTQDELDAMAWGRGEMSIMDPKRQAKLAESAWATYRSESNRINKKNEKPTQQILYDFAADTGVIPPSYGRTLDKTIMSNGPVEARVAAIIEFTNLNAMTGGNLRYNSKLGISDAASAMAIDMAATLKTLPPEEQLKAMSNYLMGLNNRSDAGLKNQWTDVYSRADKQRELFQVHWSTMQEAGVKLPEMTDEFLSVAKKAYEDEYYRNGGSASLAAHDALVQTLQKTYIVGDQLMTGRNPLNENVNASANRTAGDENPVWVSMQDIVAQHEGIDMEDVVWVPVAGDNGFMAVYLYGGPENQVLGYLGNNELTERGLEVQNAVNAQGQLDAAKQKRKEFEATLGSPFMGQYDAELNQAAMGDDLKEKKAAAVNEPMTTEERIALNAEIDAAMSEVNAVTVAEKEKLEAAKEGLNSPDPAKRAQAEMEVKIRRSPEFIHATEEIQDKLLERGREVVATEIEAGLHLEETTGEIQDPVEKSKNAVRTLREEIKRRKLAEQEAAE